MREILRQRIEKDRIILECIFNGENDEIFKLTMSGRVEYI